MRFHPRIPAFYNCQFALSLFQSRQTPYQYHSSETAQTAWLISFLSAQALRLSVLEEFYV
ncbi:hypothetical protein RISK_000195 [Rhodopirellula islandica]|uniref:Uncharacterized protein n=1 Tax=Rhodopirellula islandica TaxID=595434 RepID=A0A0J1BMJ9_RHOIS|nr:hypothetical protein RISK_000195 [Rhodopirellula islandica]